MSNAVADSRSRCCLCLLALALIVLSYGCAGVTGSSNSTADLTMTPPSVSFGNVNVGNSASVVATLTNTSILPVTVGSVGISGAGFSVTGAPNGLTLPAGKSATLGVMFAPSSAGAVIGKITATEQASGDQLSVALSGTGVTGSAHSVTLSWSPSTSSVAGYRAYRSTNSGGPYTALNSAATSQLRFVDSTAQSGATYYYVVTAVTADSIESVYSSQVTAAIPKP